MDEVTGLVVVYKTLDYIKEAYESFRKFYPDLPLLIVDNSEGDECSEYIQELYRRDPKLNILMEEQNIGHGLGLDAGIRRITTKHIFFFDSDVRFLQGNLIEKMLDIAGDEYYIVSKNTYVDRGGRNIPRDFTGERIKFCYGYSALLNRDMYFKYPPLTKYGLCILEAYLAIHDEGKSEKLLKSFNDLHLYVYHASGGTRARYGDVEDIVP